LCGILLYVGTEHKRAEFQNGLEALKHRGPDEVNLLNLELGINANIQVYLGHTRLSIVDDELSKQPMFKDKIHLIYNGEIYNFKSVKKELEEIGVRFKTNGDTEVLLESYKAWGMNCVSKFIGMWSFAIIDQSKGRIYVSRDRLGVKPLYYYSCGGNLVISSEIKAILPFLDEVYANKNEAIKYLIYGPQETTEKTFFSDVNRVKAAENLEFNFNGELIHSDNYYSIESLASKKNVTKNTSKALKDLISDAVALRISPDKTTAITLSGGVDSNIILSQARLSKKTPTFTAVYDEFGKDMNETDLISKALLDGQVQNQKVLCTISQVLESINDVIFFQDEPFDTMGIFAQNFVYKAVSEEGIKVTLDGQGADELFLGYPNFRSIVLFTALKNLDFKYIMANKFLLKSEVLKHMMALLVPKLFHRMYFYKRARTIFKTREKWIGSSKNRYFKMGNFKSLIESNIRDHLSVLLRYVDRNSMQHSVEARGPFLDFRLLEFAVTLGYKDFYNNSLSKKILRDAYQGMVHSDILTNKVKLGFPVPEKEWMTAIKEKYSNELISNDLVNELNLKLDEETLYNWKVYSLYFWIKGFDIKGWK